MDIKNVAHYTAIFLSNLEKQNKSKYTLIAYKKDLQQFGEYVEGKGITTVSKISKNNIDSFIESLMNGSYTKKSASRKLNSIRTFFRVLKAEGAIDKNPSLEVSHPKFSHATPRILTKLEYRALRDAAKEEPRTYAMVELLLQTGIKIGELADLEIEDIKEDHLIIKGYAKNLEREVPLNAAGAKALEAYLKIRNMKVNTRKVFITRTGKPLLIRNVRQIINRCFTDVGITDATVNDLRNTFIGHQLSTGASANYIAKIVGHRRLSSTERFLNVVKSENEKKEKLDEL
jgi:integrase/recombinase XerC